MVIKDSAAAEQAKNRRGNDSRADISKKIAERGPGAISGAPAE